MESFSQEIPWKIFSELGPLILLKSNFPEFSTFCTLKIGLQNPSWCETTSTGFVYSISKNRDSVITFLENINKEKWTHFYGPLYKSISNAFIATGISGFITNYKTVDIVYVAIDNMDTLWFSAVN